MTETQLYTKLKNEFLKHVPEEHFHFTRIESHMTPGIPDINCCLDGHEFWIECKIYPYTLNPLQRSWIKKRELAGGRVFIFIYKNNIKEISSFCKHILHIYGY